MEMKILLTILFGWMGACRGEAPYTIQDILTADSPTPSRSKDWKPSQGIPLEVSGMDFLPSGKLAVAIRKGEIWLLNGVLGNAPDKISYQRFATGLHEPLGLLWDKDSLLVTQRTEVTRLRDTNADGVADEYLTEGSGWNVSGSYHGYAYGPQRDGLGQLWVSLNVDMGDFSNNKVGWRGWAGVLRDREFLPMAAGLRSPCGLGANAAGDMFCVDQQGTWVPATPIHHLRKGAFFLNPEGIDSQNQPGSPVHLSAKVPEKVPYPAAVNALSEMRPPAVWLPYNKMGRSGTDLALCPTRGFGPFAGQFMVAEFTDAKVGRVFLEQVDGQYQGAAFPFLSGFASGIVRLRFATDGSLFVGMTSRGWSSLGTKAYGLQRVTWNGATPFAIKEMRARPDGFQLSFTEAVNRTGASNPAAYQMKSYTYFYSSAYGSDEIDVKELKIERVEVGNDAQTVMLKISGLRELYVHELHVTGITSEGGGKLDHDAAYYTLNKIPR